MDQFVTAISVILGKYALDKGVELGKEVGPKALGTVKEMFGMVLDRVKKTDRRTAEKFPENPEGYQAPLADVVGEIAKGDPKFADQLKAMLAQYEEARKEYPATAGTSYQAQAGDSSALAQGAGAVAAALGGIAVGGDVRGEIHTAGERKGDAKKNQE